MKQPCFRPESAWLEETLILAIRYQENRGVFWKGGEWHEERVKPGRVYAWTTDQELARRRAAGQPDPVPGPIEGKPFNIVTSKFFKLTPAA